MIKKRYASLTILQIILSCFIILGLSTFQLSLGNIISNKVYVSALSIMISLMLAVGVANIMVMRQWQIIFDNNFAMATQHTDWKLLINIKSQRHSIESYNWWMKHKNDWGNYYFVRKVVCIKVLIECGIMLIPWTYVLSLFFCFFFLYICSLLYNLVF